LKVMFSLFTDKVEDEIGVEKGYSA
jgi:hypothetical protein